MDKFLEQRALCPVFKKYAYLLTGSTGPIPTYVYEGVKGYMDRRLTEGGDAVFRGEGTFTMIARVREVFGQMLGCSGSDLAFGPNSSAMFCIVTQGLPFDKGVAVTVHEGHLPEQDTVIRASCHYVNTREDIDRLVGALGELMG